VPPENCRLSSSFSRKRSKKHRCVAPNLGEADPGGLGACPQDIDQLYSSFSRKRSKKHKSLARSLGEADPGGRKLSTVKSVENDGLYLIGAIAYTRNIPEGKIHWADIHAPISGESSKDVGVRGRFGDGTGVFVE
jgi:hypothetical protein